MAFNYSPKIVTDGLVFYTDPFNFKSRDRSIGFTGGTIVDLTSRYDLEGIFDNEPTVSDDYKYITFDGTDDRIRFEAYTSAESFQIKQPFYRSKPQTFTLSAWVKSGTSGAGVMFWGGGNDYFLKIPPLTATTYTQGIYTSVIGENWSATTPTEAAKNVPTFEITVDSGGTITKAVAETTLGFGSPPIDENVIVRISGDTIGGTTPADDVYFLWRSATSSQIRWGFEIGTVYRLTIGDSITRGSFDTTRSGNEPNEWNLITVLDEGELVSGSRKCYVNGELINSSPVAPTIPTFFNGTQMNPGTANAGQLYMGYGSTSSFANYLNGSLGPCMMYDRALTQEEIQQNYNAIKNRFDII